MSNSIQYIDQTLGEGFARRLPQAALVIMAQLLSELPITVMDVPFEQIKEKTDLLDPFQHMLRVRINSSAKEVAAVHDKGWTKVIIDYYHRPGQAIIPHLQEALNKSQQLAMDVSLNLKNASTLSIDEIAAFFKQLGGAALASFIYSDSGSRLDPFTTYETILGMQKCTAYPLEFYGYNRYGLATANALSAVRAGAERIATAVAGVGAPGHAALEEVLLSAKYLLKRDTALVTGLANRCAAILTVMEEDIAVDKAVIGDNIFAHESGLHVYGIKKNPQIYEAFPPEVVGLARHLVVGKHSGATSLQIVLQEQGIHVNASVLQGLLKKVRQTVTTYKRSLSPSEVLNLCQCGGV